MLTAYKSSLTGQFEAAFAMLDKLLRKCPADNWDDPIANDTFRQVAYHALFYTELYFMKGEAAFALRDLHRLGGDERKGQKCPGLTGAETLTYLADCRQTGLTAIAAETEESLSGVNTFVWLGSISRTELHVYNLRHLSHHIGQLSAFLRRIFPKGQGWWLKSGWPE